MMTVMMLWFNNCSRNMRTNSIAPNVQMQKLRHRQSQARKLGRLRTYSTPCKSSYSLPHPQCIRRCCSKEVFKLFVATQMSPISGHEASKLWSPGASGSRPHAVHKDTTQLPPVLRSFPRSLLGVSSSLLWAAVVTCSFLLMLLGHLPLQPTVWLRVESTSF